MRRPPEKPRSRRKPGRRTSVADAGGSTAAARRAERGEFAPEMPAGKAPQRQPKLPSASVAHEVGRTKVAKRSRSHDPPPEKTEIGFKKPPKAHSWKKGESGNPKGRNKGSRNKKTIIIRLMEGRLGRKIPDPKKLTAQEALLWKAIQKASPAMPKPWRSPSSATTTPPPAAGPGRPSRLKKTTKSMTRCAPKSDVKSRKKMMQANEVRELDAALRLRFDLFLMRCFLTVNPGATFMDNWHIDHMAYQAERIANGEIRRLIVNMPPRNLKSLTFNVALSAFLLGHDPRKRIFCISYGAELAADLSFPKSGAEQGKIADVLETSILPRRMSAALKRKPSNCERVIFSRFIDFPKAP